MEICLHSVCILVFYLVTCVCTPISNHNQEADVKESQAKWSLKEIPNLLVPYTNGHVFTYTNSFTTNPNQMSWSKCNNRIINKIHRRAIRSPVTPSRRQSKFDKTMVSYSTARGRKKFQLAALIKPRYRKNSALKSTIHPITGAKDAPKVNTKGVRRPTMALPIIDATEIENNRKPSPLKGVHTENGTTKKSKLKIKTIDGKFVDQKGSRQKIDQKGSRQKIDQKGPRQKIENNRDPKIEENEIPGITDGKNLHHPYQTTFPGKDTKTRVIDQITRLHENEQFRFNPFQENACIFPRAQITPKSNFYSILFKDNENVYGVPTGLFDYSTVPLHKLFGPPYDHYKSDYFKRANVPTMSKLDENKLLSIALPPKNFYKTKTPKPHPVSQFDQHTTISTPTYPTSTIFTVPTTLPQNIVPLPVNANVYYRPISALERELEEEENIYHRISSPSIFIKINQDLNIHKADAQQVTKFHQVQSTPLSREIDEEQSSPPSTEIHQVQSKPTSRNIHQVKLIPPAGEIHQGQPTPTTRKIHQEKPTKPAREIHQEQPSKPAREIHQEPTKPAREILQGQLTPLSKLIPIPLSPAVDNSVREGKELKRRPKKHQKTSLSKGIHTKMFPSLARVPETSFSCRGRKPGMYADVEAECQVWHTCESETRQHSFLCPNGTTFSQQLLTCDWWYNVNCKASEQHLQSRPNLELFKVSKIISRIGKGFSDIKDFGENELPSDLDMRRDKDTKSDIKLVKVGNAEVMPEPFHNSMIPVPRKMVLEYIPHFGNNYPTFFLQFKNKYIVKNISNTTQIRERWKNNNNNNNQIIVVGGKL